MAPDGQGHSGWEEMPFWRKGYGDLGYVLKDETIIRPARRWMEGALVTQEPDGFFGPRRDKSSLDGKPNLWPHMVMLNVLQSFHEFTGDARVIPLMTRYCRWLDAQPGEYFGNGYRPRIRFRDNIEAVYWLYNRTGDGWLLELARKTRPNMARWSSDAIHWHNINIAKRFREPVVFYLQAHERGLLEAAERNHQKGMGLYGQFPGGGFAGDEN